LSSELKNLYDRDDITDKLLANNVPIDVLFTEQLKKYEPVINLLRQNYQAQDRILIQISSENEKFVANKQINENLAKREQVFQKIDHIFRIYSELKNELDAGAQFYTDFNREIVKFRGKCEEFVSARKIQLEETRVHLTTLQYAIPANYVSQNSPNRSPQALPTLQQLQQASLQQPTYQPITLQQPSINLQQLQQSHYQPNTHQQSNILQGNQGQQLTGFPQGYTAIPNPIVPTNHNQFGFNMPQGFQQLPPGFQVVPSNYQQQYPPAFQKR